MRKVAKDILSRWNARRSGTVGNTTVNVKPDGTGVFLLHGNAIVRVDTCEDGARRVEVSLAGWPTVTTRSRINELMYGLFGFAGARPHVSRIKGTDYVSALRPCESGEMSPNGWYLVGFLPAVRS